MGAIPVRRDDYVDGAIVVLALTAIVVISAAIIGLLIGAATAVFWIAQWFYYQLPSPK